MNMEVKALVNKKNVNKYKYISKRYLKYKYKKMGGENVKNQKPDYIFVDYIFKYKELTTRIILSFVIWLCRKKLLLEIWKLRDSRKNLKKKVRDRLELLEKYVAIKQKRAVWLRKDREFEGNPVTALNRPPKNDLERIKRYFNLERLDQDPSQYVQKSLEVWRFEDHVKWGAKTTIWSRKDREQLEIQTIVWRVNFRKNLKIEIDKMVEPRKFLRFINVFTLDKEEKWWYTLFVDSVY